MENGQDVSTPKQDTAMQSPTFGKDASFYVNEAVGSASMSPSGRDVVLASREGLHIIDLDKPYSPPRHLSHRTPWEVADVQWSPFASRDYWVASTSNQKALVWNLELSTVNAPIEHVLHAHSRAITDINFSAHHPDILATCAVDSFVHCWDLRSPSKPAITFCDWFAGATQVKYNRQDSHVLASSHDKYLHIWDDRKGAVPLQSITAHATKIYGVDWNRTKPTCVITCSLDKTIKFWDYAKSTDEPDKVIQTPFPVWRARHTPFGWGVLAMPQRGSNDLHLFDSLRDAHAAPGSHNEPVHSFVGHQNQVKEFLWRTRTPNEADAKIKEFQLVTWGTDRNLRLHRIEDRMLELVGCDKTASTVGKQSLSRQGAAYKTFHGDGIIVSSNDKSVMSPLPGTGSMLRDALSPGMAKAPIPFHGLQSRYSEGEKVGMHIKSTERKHQNPITWMKGVKFSRPDVDLADSKTSDGRLNLSGVPPWDRPESLGDEVTYVGDKYNKVSFDKIDVSARTADISLNGPWGIGDQLVYVKLFVVFPEDYPGGTAPHFKIEKTSSISDATFSWLRHALKIIAERCALHAHGCLESLFCFLLGERTLEDNLMAIEKGNLRMLSKLNRADDSSSDDEDDAFGKMGLSGSRDVATSAADIIDDNANANVPLPKACGALWADDGRLICFFQSKEDKPSLFSTLNVDGNDKLNRQSRGFPGFGRLQPRSRRAVTRTYDISNLSGSDSSESSGPSGSSANSSISDDESDVDWNPFNISSAWRSAPVRPPPISSANRSHWSSAGHGFKNQINGGSKMYIALHDLQHLLPSKKQLAEDYLILGQGPTVCNHNADVAAKCGMLELEDVWRLCGLILCNEVPLEVVRQPNDQKDIRILARRALANTNRRDSGLDLSFDAAESVTKPDLKGRVKWGQHPLAATWLLQILFEHFERLADVQMLAMLSCIFSEPAAEVWTTNATSNLQQYQQPMATKAPSFSLDYFSSANTPGSLRNPTSFPQESHPATGLSTQETYGSYGSSNIHRSSEGSDLDPEFVYSPSISSQTPAEQGRRRSLSFASRTSGGYSPEENRSMKREISNIGSSLAASFSSRFSFIHPTSSSPPSGSDLARKKSASSFSGVDGVPNRFSNSNGGIRFQSQAEYSPREGNNGSHSMRSSPYDSILDIKPGSGGQARHFQRSRSTLFENSFRSTTYDIRQHDQTQTSLEYSVQPVELSPDFAEETSSEQDVDMTASVALKNQHQFDDEACASVPLLDPSAANKFNAYKDAYAQLLFTWGLDIKRCEMLKLKGLVPYFTATGKSSETQHDDSESGPSAESNFTMAPLSDRRLQCSICSEVIGGLHKTCLSCGHITHMSCITRWIEEESQDEEHGCEAGCGCHCSSYPDSEEPEMNDSVDGDALGVYRGAGDWEDEWGAVKGLGQAHSRVASTATNLHPG